MRSAPDWLIAEPFNDVDLGVLKSGKEAQINLIERTGDDGTSCLLAKKRYLPREVTQKGQLEATGMQRASTFRNDSAYREGRQFRRSRERRAVEQMTRYGKRLLQDRWMGHEHDVMARLYAKDVAVPYPVSFNEDAFILEYVGDAEGAAPQLAASRLRGAELQSAFDQLVDGIASMTEEGFAHGDLSAFNLLWWDDRLWFIDFPQAIDIAVNPQGLDFLHRDLTNVCTWFNRRGLDVDAERVFVDMLNFI